MGVPYALCGAILRGWRGWPIKERSARSAISEGGNHTPSLTAMSVPAGQAPAREEDGGVRRGPADTTAHPGLRYKIETLRGTPGWLWRMKGHPYKGDACDPFRKKEASQVLAYEAFPPLGPIYPIPGIDRGKVPIPGSLDLRRSADGSPVF